MEVRDALSSGNPAAFPSRLPVQMDGSCNGLQHYAALGRDSEGGNAVNLRPNPAPQVPALSAPPWHFDGSPGTIQKVLIT